MNWRSIAGWSFSVAPAGQIGGWIFMRLGGNDLVEPWWTIAHSVWLIGFLALTIVCIELYRMAATGAARWSARVSLAVALTSVAASIAEMLVDLYVGLATSSAAELDALSMGIRAIPGAEEILYGIGTQLVYLGFLALIIQLAVMGRIRPMTLVLLLVTLGLFVGYEAVNGPLRYVLMPLAVAFMWLALAPLGRRLLKTPEPVTG